MKKVLLMIGSLLMVCSLSFSAETVTPVSEEESIISEATVSESATSENSMLGVPSEISKGDSFMASFGMGGDSVAGGEAGMSSSAGAAGIAGSVANTGASNLTSSQNTPYYR